MSKGLEAFDRILNANNHFKYDTLELMEKDAQIVYKALQEQEKTLKVIFIKRVDMWHLADLLEQTYEMYLAFCESEGYAKDYILTEEEFDLLKRYYNEQDNKEAK